MRTAVKKWKSDDQKKFRQIRREVKALINGQRFVSNHKNKADLSNCFFQSAFTANDGTIDSPWRLLLYSPTTQANLFYHQTEVAKVLNDIDLAKAPGPDNIGGRLLKETAPEISVSLCRLFNLSLSRGEFPDQGKLANVCPVFKKDDPALAKKYCQISSLSISSKCFERCVFNHCYPHILPRLCHLQHGFLRGRSTVTQLAQVNHEVINAFAEGKEIDVVYLDFAKAFDKVSYSTVINKLSRFCILGQLKQWFQSYLSNRSRRVALQGTYFNLLQLTFEVAQGSLLGPLLFPAYIDDIPRCTQHDYKIAISLTTPNDTRSFRSLLIRSLFRNFSPTGVTSGQWASACQSAKP